MAFTIVQAQSSFHILDDDGDVYTTLVLPTGVTVDPSIRAQFTPLNGKLVITRATSINVWVDPEDFSVRPLAVLPPVAPPVIAAGSGTGLTGTYYGAYSYVVIINGVVVQESPRSPLSLPVTLTNDDVDWSNLVPSTEAHVNGYRLYRTVTDGDPTVLFEAQQGGGAGTTFTGDATPDAALSLLPAPDAGNAPGGTIPGTRLSLITAWRERLWAVSSDPSQRDQVAYTESGNPFVWRAANRIPIPVKGQDEWGITGFLPRRDELVVTKRSRFVKILGDSNENFEALVLAEGVGCAAPDSCIVIEDMGYCRSTTTVYEVGPAGVLDIAAGKVGAWFQTDAQFDVRSVGILNTIGSWNPVTDAYELQMPVATQESDNPDPSHWAAFNRRYREWTGAHFTGAAEITARGTYRDEAGTLQPLLGGSDGFLYKMNQAPAYDAAGSAPGTVVGIAIDWRTKRYTMGTPDQFHVWGRITIHQRAQGDGADGVGEPAYAHLFSGAIDERNLYVNNAIETPFFVAALTLTKGRVELPRAGVGQSVMLWFRHNFIADPTTGGITGVGDSPSDLELWAIEIPFTTVGRR